MRRAGIVANSFVIASLAVLPAAAQTAGRGLAFQPGDGPAPVVAVSLRVRARPMPVPGPSLAPALSLVLPPLRLTSYLDAQARDAIRDGLLAESTEDRSHHFEDAEEHARGALELDPRDLEARYYLAAAVGLRAEHAGLKDQIRLGREAYDEARAVLAVDPDHAGAHHIIGRLNAEIMRMGGMARFVVGRLLGSDLVRQASWEAAEAHLRAAVEAEPDRALHRVALARVYRDTHRPELAREQLDLVFGRVDADPLRPLAEDEARVLLASIDRRN